MKSYSLAPQYCHQPNIHAECHGKKLGIMKQQLVYTIDTELPMQHLSVSIYLLGP